MLQVKAGSCNASDKGGSLFVLFCRWKHYDGQLFWGIMKMQVQVRLTILGIRCHNAALALVRIKAAFPAHPLFLVLRPNPPDTFLLVGLQVQYLSLPFAGFHWIDNILSGLN